MCLTELLPGRERIASFDVDLQKGFTPLCPDELPVPEGDRIEGELNALARHAALRVGSKDAHPANASWVADDNHPPLSPIEGDNMDLRWPVRAVPGTRGFELLDGLPHPSRYDFFVWKGVEPDMHPYNACFHDFARRLSTGLVEFLRAHGIEAVIVGGLATDYCVKSNVLELRRAGFRVIVNEAAERGVALDTTRAAPDECRAPAPNSSPLPRPCQP
ncbi:MAG: isochorismatase family protein [Gammaproteobacteria bacterium]|nr:isochorismatase family protein [Gammaproteobacteria bacterium]